MIPVIEEIRRRLHVIVGVDTRKPEIACRAAAAGAQLISDINGLRDPDMRRAVAQTGLSAVIMHIQGQPRVANPNPEYRSVIGDIVQFLHRRVEECVADGVNPERLVVDPGPGFGKTAAHDLQVLHHLQELRGFRQPVMLATSRKSFIGHVLNRSPNERLIGSLATVSYALTKGVDIIRTHDVRATREVVDIIHSIEMTS